MTSLTGSSGLRQCKVLFVKSDVIMLIILILLVILCIFVYICTIVLIDEL